MKAETPRDVLFVEDNSDDVILTLRKLEKHGFPYKVAVARDGEEAMNRLFEAGDPTRPADALPELVLLDLNLPKISGFEILQAMHENPRTRAIPVIVLTTSREQKDILKSYDFGAKLFMSKPLNYAKLMQTVKEAGLAASRP